MKPADSLMRLRASARWMLYGTIALLVASGLGWIVVHFANDVDDLRRLSIETAMLKFHGAGAFAMLIATGAMSAHHVRRGWLLGRNRGSGAIVIAILVILIVSGYALYYLVSDSSRTPISIAHWAVGLAFVPMLFAHIAIGRRATATAHHHTRRIKRKVTARPSAR